MAPGPPAPEAPLLVALEVERARREAQAAGWRIAAITHTAPPSSAPAGDLRVLKQSVVGPRALALVVAAGVALAHPGGSDAAE